MAITNPRQADLDFSKRNQVSDVASRRLSLGQKAVANPVAYGAANNAPAPSRNTGNTQASAPVHGRGAPDLDVPAYPYGLGPIPRRNTRTGNRDACGNQHGQHDQRHCRSECGLDRHHSARPRAFRGACDAGRGPLYKTDLLSSAPQSSLPSIDPLHQLPMPRTAGLGPTGF